MNSVNNWVPFAAAIAVLLLVAAYAVLQPPKPEPEYKTYPAAASVALPLPSHAGMSLEQAIRERRSIRGYSGASLSLSEISQLLFAAQGITHPNGFRSAPSAGGLYPLETYIIANRVENLASGIYHYNVRSHSLELQSEGDFSGELWNASLGQTHVKDAAAVFVFSAVENRTSQKYGDAAEKFIHLEAGHASQNLLLETTSLGLGAVPVGGFDESKMNALLGLDGKGEYVVYLNAVGRKG